MRHSKHMYFLGLITGFMAGMIVGAYAMWLDAVFGAK